MTMTIETKDGNFLVKTCGLKLETADGVVIDFFEGDYLRISNLNNKPCMEFEIDGTPVAVELKSEAQFKSVLDRIDSMSDYKTESIELMDALADEKKISLDELLEAYSIARETQANKTVMKLPIVRKAHESTQESKIKQILDTKMESTADIAMKESKTIGDSPFFEAEDPDEGDECELFGKKGKMGKNKEGKMVCIINGNGGNGKDDDDKPDDTDEA